jgi:hypothetical protein
VTYTLVPLEKYDSKYVPAADTVVKNDVFTLVVAAAVTA